MSASERRLAANRANARKSTGPVTPEGKARSALNGLKHGLFSPLDLLPSEDPADFDAHAQALLDALLPVGGLETDIAHRIISVSWRLRRAPRGETRLLTDAPPSPQPDLPAHAAVPPGPAALNAFSSHESRLHRQLTADIVLLRTIQSARLQREPLDADDDPIPPQRYDRYGRFIGPYSTVPLHAELLRIEKELGLPGAEEPGWPEQPG